MTRAAFERRTWRGRGLPPGRVQPSLDRPEVAAGAVVAEVVAGAVLLGAGPRQRGAVGRGATAGAHDARGLGRVVPRHGAGAVTVPGKTRHPATITPWPWVRPAQRTAGAGPFG